jgi:hypothetical protein
MRRFQHVCWSVPDSLSLPVACMLNLGHGESAPIAQKHPETTGINQGIFLLILSLVTPDLEASHKALKQEHQIESVSRRTEWWSGLGGAFQVETQDGGSFGSTCTASDQLLPRVVVGTIPRGHRDGHLRPQSAHHCSCRQVRFARCTLCVDMILSQILTKPAPGTTQCMGLEPASGNYGSISQSLLHHDQPLETCNRWKVPNYFAWQASLRSHSPRHVQL